MDRETFKHLEKKFNPTILARGKTYFKNGTVKNLKFEDSKISAQVQGSEYAPYHVKFSIVPNFSNSKIDIKGQCSCSYTFYCKHMAAVFYAYYNQTNKELTSSSPVPVWMQKIFLTATNELDITDNNSEKKLNTDGRIIYFLNSKEITPLKDLRVSYLYQQIKKNSDFGPPKEIPYRYLPNYDYHSKPAPFMTEFDFNLFNCMTDPYARGTLKPLRGEIGLSLLEKLVETKRFFTDESFQTPIKWGPEKNIQILWEEDDNLFELTYNLDGVSSKKNVILLDTEPMFYLDIKNGLMGLSLSPLPRTILKQILEMRPINAQEAALFSNHAMEVPIMNCIPYPPLKNITVHEINEIPTPILILKGAFGEYLDPPIPTASIYFQYGKKRAEAHQPKPSLEYQEATDRYIYTRNLDFENIMCETIDKIGLTPAIDGILKTLDLPIQALKKNGNLRSFAFLESLENGYERVRHSYNKWMFFLNKNKEELEKTGWTIEISKDFPLVDFGLNTQWYSDIEESSYNWFDLDMGVIVDGKKVNLLPVLLSALKSIPDLDLIDQSTDEHLFLNADGKMYGFPRTRLLPLLALIGQLTHSEFRSNNKIRLDQMDMIQYLNQEENHDFLTQEIRSKNIAHLRSWAKKLKGLVDVPEINTPKALQAKLRPYQQQGLNWMQYLAQNQLPGILADDMGLGKTVQTIAHLLQEKQEGRLTKPVLIVGPTSVMPNWRMELKRFAPNLKCMVLHGTQRHGKFEDIAHMDIVCTTYPLIVRDIKELEKYDYHTIVLDEAQFIKNSKTQTNKVLCTLKSDRRLCLTGTPLENHLGEIWSIFNFLSPGLLGGEEHFKRTFRTPIEKRGDSERQKLLNHRLRLFMMRRTKDEVLLDLPSKTEIIVRSEFGQKQRDLYEATRLLMHEKIKDELKKHGEKYNSIVVLDALMKLRQICCDPSLLKVKEAKTIESAKLNQLMEMLPEMIEEGRNILLFSQFTSLLSNIEKRLEVLKIPYVKLTGQTKDRETPIRQFQNGEVPLFLISLKSGGTGLNLTAADTVIHFDPWWNPATENQATDRAHRIGQTKPIFVYKFIASQSIEEKILEMQAKKAELAKALFEDASKGPIKMTPKDISNLFDPI